MGLIEYLESQRISAEDPGFYSLIMAAMRKADSPNGYKLREAWPAVWDELNERYNAPGGAITDKELEWLEKQRE